MHWPGGRDMLTSRNILISLIDAAILVSSAMGAVPVSSNPIPQPDPNVVGLWLLDESEGPVGEETGESTINRDMATTVGESRLTACKRVLSIRPTSPSEHLGTIALILALVAMHGSRFPTAILWT